MHLDRSPCSEECIKNNHYGKQPDFPDPENVTVTPEKNGKQVQTHALPDEMDSARILTTTTDCVDKENVTPEQNVINESSTSDRNRTSTDNVLGEPSTPLSDATNWEQTQTINLPDAVNAHDDVTLPELDFDDDLRDLQGDNAELVPVDAARAPDITGNGHK